MRAYFMRLEVSSGVGKLEQMLRDAGSVALRRHLKTLDVLFPADAVEIEEGEEPDEWEERAFAELVALVAGWAERENAEVGILEERAVEVSDDLLAVWRKAG